MDDYTWRKKLEARRKRRKRERLFVVFIFVLVLCSFFIYIGVYTKTPDYAMKTAQKALAENDSATFERYVDLVSVTSKAYDDLTVDLFKYDEQLSERERSLFENFYVLIRPQIAQGAADIIDYRIKNGVWTLPDGILKGRQLGVDFDLLLERSLIRHTTITGIGNAASSGDKATIELNVIEDYTGTPFTLQLALQNVSGTGWTFGGYEFELFNHKWRVGSFNINLGIMDWRVVGINNYREYLDIVSPTLKQELANYIDSTSEIVNRYNAIFKTQQNTFTAMQRTRDGTMTAQQRTQIADYIENNIIPTLQNRQQELDSIAAPNGAIYLSKLRRESTNITISAWSYYIKGLRENDSKAFDTAESIHKQELAFDQRIEEIIHNSAITRDRPEPP
ncbi:MAG: hypothetical protein IJ563_12230 [Selenomonadaceae bacterium]|nr:hypothetical protein [Selenomonadaceae bacterium]MBR1859823.1 hypothetical protein [Selenomonadaceae bacterium]